MPVFKKNLILGKKLAFVIAHPDDESFLSAGTILCNRLRGGENYIICATFGERGKARMGHATTQRILRNIRKKELSSVCRFLRVKKLCCLNLSDGKLEKQKAKLTKLIEEHLRAIKPDFVFSFGKDGITGHKDHVVIGLVAKHLSKKLSFPFAAFVSPPSLTIKVLKQRRKHGVYHDQIPKSNPNLIIPIDGQSKLKALRLHVSQFGKMEPLADFPKPVRKQILSKEYFKLD